MSALRVIVLIFIILIILIVIGAGIYFYIKKRKSSSSSTSSSSSSSSSSASSNPAPIGTKVPISGPRRVFQSSIPANGTDWLLRDVKLNWNTNGDSTFVNNCAVYAINGNLKGGEQWKQYGSYHCTKNPSGNGSLTCVLYKPYYDGKFVAALPGPPCTDKTPYATIAVSDPNNSKITVNVLDLAPGSDARLRPGETFTLPLTDQSKQHF